LRTVESEQLSLIPNDAIAGRPASLDRIYTLSDTHEALMYGCELARRPAKQLYGEMEVDKTTWSRIVNGEWDLSGRNILRFSRAVRNDAYLLYLNHVHGYDLTSLQKVQDDNERRIAELEKAVAERDRTIQLLVGYQKGKA